VVGASPTDDTLVKDIDHLQPLIEPQERLSTRSEETAAALAPAESWYETTEHQQGRRLERPQHRSGRY
jgi:hypothetical protein